MTIYSDADGNQIVIGDFYKFEKKIKGIIREKIGQVLDFRKDGKVLIRVKEKFTGYYGSKKKSTTTIIEDYIVNPSSLIKKNEVF